MKKLRKLLAGLSATIVFLTCSVTAFGMSAEECPNYQKWASKYLSLTDDYESKYSRYEDVFYEISDNNLITYTYLVLSFSNEKVVYGRGETFWVNMSLSIEKNDIVPSKEAINQFLNENKLKAYVDVYEEYSSELKIELVYDEDVTYNDVQNVANALNNEFGFNPSRRMPCIQYEVIFKVEENVPSINFSTVTIAGDIDLNNEQGISDIVTLSKFNANPELYPITDSTALANADMNQDGKVDTLDATILIEMALGTYESAV